MKASYPDLSEKLQKSEFWLSAIAVGLTIIQLNLNWKLLGNTDTVTTRFLYWAAILYLVWKKRAILSLKSDLFSSLSGLLIIFLILFKTTSLFWFESFFIRFSPLFLFLGLGLIASGIKGLKQYKQEFMILILLLTEGVLTSVISTTVDVSLISAKFTNFLLWYLGFEVSRQGVIVSLPTGAIEIYPGCSGLNVMILLFQFSLVFLAIFPFKNVVQKISLPIISIIIAFIFNSFRIILMALLVAASNDEGFAYWHGEPGGQIFSTVSILAFGFVCNIYYEKMKTLDVASENQ
ncbi:cyanoexosortase A [Cronbergia sp. UHCC 0137]|uniref:cyanoexosortase A n=1 Tax=Cronbergia sp. UHCC 0137 TaxID=3110239 RepID=UPI002B2130CE|nr:cyanoexosortase A [Cronbergia sp. UHCC 0137]MEA5620206.1 cyanoexosortase A [Cronbergia sp. UHCC 0137]